MASCSSLRLASSLAHGLGVLLGYRLAYHLAHVAHERLVVHAVYIVLHGAGVHAHLLGVALGHHLLYVLPA